MGPTFYTYRGAVTLNRRDIPSDRTADRTPVGRDSLPNRCCHAVNVFRFPSDWSTAVGKPYREMQACVSKHQLEIQLKRYELLVSGLR